MSKETISFKSSSSNLVFKTSKQIINDRFQEKSSKLLNITLWTISSFFSVAKIDLNANLTGTVIRFNVKDVIVIGLTAWMLQRGLCARSTALTIPWISATFYTLYYNNYKSLSRMLKILKHIRRATVLPWIALFACFLGLMIRVLLIIRVLQLSANLWYGKRLEKELYKSSNM